MRLYTNQTRIILMILCIFAAGLVFFFLFSAPYGDGLEKTMEEGEVEEDEPVYQAPLDYGDNYLASFAMGVVGFFVVLLVLLVLGRLLGRKDEAHND
jgi:cobalt/nickel transport protein